MKNTLLSKKVKKSKTLKHRVEEAYKKSAKWVKAIIGEDYKIAINQIIHSIKMGYNINPQTKERLSPKRLFIAQAKSRARHLNIETKQFIFRNFRELEPAVYAKYNSYMYRNGYSASQYFYENVTLKKDKSMVTATLPLPKAKPGRFSYGELEITYDYSPKTDDMNLEAYMYF